MKIQGDNVAASKDEQRRVHAVSAVCGHMGCIVGWNATDRTWDCPCHGSRFGLTGQGIHGPATRPLGSPYPTQLFGAERYWVITGGIAGINGGNSKACVRS